MSGKRIKDLLSTDYDKTFRVAVDNELSGTHYMTLEQIKNNSGSGGGLIDGTLLTSSTTTLPTSYEVQNDCLLVIIHQLTGTGLYFYSVNLDINGNPIYTVQKYDTSDSHTKDSTFSIPVKKGVTINGTASRSGVKISFYEYKLS